MIEINDLVMIVKWPCCNSKDLGKIFKVGFIEAFNEKDVYCEYCSHLHINIGIQDKGAGPDKGWWYPTSWLKKIPPLELLDEEIKKEELKV